MRVSIVFLAVAVLAISCSKEAESILVPNLGTKVAESILRPSAGVDLPGPIPTPKKVGRKQGSKPLMLALGKDRPVVSVNVPTPPSKASIGFTFGDGKRGWVTKIPGSLQLPAVAYGEEKVFVSGGFDSVSFYALHAQSGALEWSATNLEDNGPTAPIYEDGELIFNTESCTLFVFDAKTGKKRWSRYLGDPTLAQPSLADGLIYASHPDEYSGGWALSTYALKTGKETWKTRIDNELLAAPIIAGDSVYAASVSGTLYRITRKDGKRVWRKKLSATTAPWIADGELFITRRQQQNEELIVVSIETGEILRTQVSKEAKYLKDVPRNLNSWKKVWAFEGSRPVVINGVRYLAMGDSIQAADPKTGEAFWERAYEAAKGKRALGSVAVAGSQVVVSTRSGEVFGLDIDTGYTLWSYDIGHNIVAEPVIAKGWIYLTTTKGNVIALNVGDTSLDGWHMFGGNPYHNGPVLPKDTAKKPI